jgi:subtilisin family serine protease
MPKLCKSGHKSFSASLPDPLNDEVGHGTHLAGLISSTAGYGDYCIVSIKYYNRNNPSENGFNLVQAIRYAIDIGVKFINISGGGQGVSASEFQAIEIALNSGIKVVVAAGNDHVDLDKNCNYFPACYDTRVVAVGNLASASPNIPAPSSNYGNRVSRWEVGTNILSNLPGGKMGYMSGTSQATAIATGKLVREALKK